MARDVPVSSELSCGSRPASMRSAQTALRSIRHLSPPVHVESEVVWRHPLSHGSAEAAW